MPELSGSADSFPFSSDDVHGLSVVGAIVRARPTLDDRLMETFKILPRRSDSTAAGNDAATDDLSMSLNFEKFSFAYPTEIDVLSMSWGGPVG